MACQGTLGCGEHRVVFSDRCGVTVVCAIEADVTSLNYGRVLDDWSDADMVVKIKGDSDGPGCCECLKDLRAWFNTMSVYRDGDLVWGPGPIINDLEGNDEGTIKAKDVGVWLDNRVIREKLVFTKTDLVQIAVDLILHGMEPDDPCNIVSNMNVTLGGVKIDKTYEAGKTTVGDALRDLAKIGLDFTVVGATIIIAPNLEYGPMASLVDEDFLADLQVEERGEEAATKWYVSGEGAIVGTAGGIDPFYGLIEKIATSDSNVQDQVAANTEAASRLKASNPVPIYVNIPDGAQLSANAPVCFEWLVPGTLFDVYLRNRCKPISLRNRLTAVKVAVTDTGESVGVTLAPLGTAATEDTPVTPDPTPEPTETTFSVATNNIMSLPKNPNVDATLAATPDASVVMVQEADIPEFHTALRNMSGYTTKSIPASDTYNAFVMYKPDVWEYVSSKFVKQYDGVAGVSKTRHIEVTRLKNKEIGREFAFISYHAVTAGNDPVRKKLRAEGDAVVQKELNALHAAGIPTVLGADLNRTVSPFKGYDVSAHHKVDHVLIWDEKGVIIKKDGEQVIATTSDHDALVLKITVKKG